MRSARIVPRNMGYYVHICNRISGMPGEYPFGDVEKEKFVRLLTEISSLFTVEVLAYQVMGNHYHLLVYVPEKPVSVVEAARRHNLYYEGRKAPYDPERDAEALSRLAEWMNNPSCFVSMLQQRFAVWFNRSRPLRRRGGLWGDRFKSMILQGGRTLFGILCYIELNCVRAGLADDPAHYRFGSWGCWSGGGRHPFAENFLKHLRHILPPEAGNDHSMTAAERFIRRELARRYASDLNLSSDEIHERAERAAAGPGLLEVCNRRVRYWTDGGIIGGKLFVMEIAAQCRTAESLAKRRLKRLVPKGGEGIFSFKTLRTIPG